MGVSTSEELRHAINSCKDLINTAPEDSEEKNKLVSKLVQLRLKLQETQVNTVMINIQYLLNISRVLFLEIRKSLETDQNY